MKERNQTIDIMRGVAVLLMIIAHAIFFFSSGANIILSIIARTSNALAFTLFLFLSGSASYYAFFSRVRHMDNAQKIRMVSRSGIILLGYYLIAFASVFTDSTIGTIHTIIRYSIQILTFTRVPSFSEFLLPFFVYSLSLILFYRVYAKLLKQPRVLLLIGVLSYIIGAILYPMFLPSPLREWKAIVVGEQDLLRFPILQYLPIFLLGLLWGKLTNRLTLHPRVYLRYSLSIGLLFLSVAAMCSIASQLSYVPIADPLNRWPPSIGFLAIGLSAICVLYGIYFLLPDKTQKTFWWRLLSYTGKDSFDLFIVHMLILFLYRTYHGPTFTDVLPILFFTSLLFTVSVLLSSANWGVSPSIFSLGKITFGLERRYTVKKRYVALIVFLTATSILYLINRVPTASLYGQTVEKLPQQLAVSVNRTWFVKMNDRTQRDLRISVHKAHQAAKYTFMFSGTELTGNLTSTSDGQAYAVVPVSHLPPNTYTLTVKQEAFGRITFSSPITIYVSEPILISWSLDWEGWDVPNDTLHSITTISTMFDGIPITHMVHPRIFIPSIFPSARATQLVDWLKKRTDENNDEIALHVHMQYDMLREAGINIHTSPQWGYRTHDGYDVPLTAYSEKEIGRVLQWSKERFKLAGLPEPLGFRAGGWYADEHVLSTLAKNGFRYDSSGRERNLWGGIAKSPWNLNTTSQPYHPSLQDQNDFKEPTLPILEIPNNGGNTYEHTSTELLARYLANYSGGVAKEKKVIVFVSHPQWGQTEFPKIEPVFRSIEEYSYKKDTGPVLFVTLSTIDSLWQ